MKEQTQSVGRDPYWDNVKGVLIILVVLAHMVGQTIPTIDESRLVWSGVFAFHMPAFLMVSGYLCARSPRDPMDRVPKLLQYYLALKLVAVALTMLLEARTIPGLKIIYPTYGSWFLLCLAYCYFTVRYLRACPPALAIGGALALSLLRGFDPTLDNTAGLVRFASFLVYFLVGYYLDMDAISAWLRRHRVLCLAAFALLFALAVASVKYKVLARTMFLGSKPYNSFYGGNLARAFSRQLLLYPLALGMSFTLLGLVGRGKGLLTYVGRNSLWVYLIHVSCMSELYQALGHIFDLNTRRGAAAAFVGLGVALLVIFALAALIQRLRQSQGKR